MASKSKRRRRVLGASCILAALIVGASSFAWFTSSDEVTNRLTATADYGVSLVEDFTPPQDMTPGQKVNKDVSAVNTGNIDALVRVSLEHEFEYSKLTSTALSAAFNQVKETYANAAGQTATNAYASETSSSYTTLGSQTAPNGYPTYLYTTYHFDFTPPSATAPSTLVELDPREYTDSDGVLHANEITTLQAGGELVVKASESVAPTSQFPVRSGDDTNSGTGIEIIYQLTSNATYVDVADSNTSKNTPYVFYDSTGDKYVAVIKNPDGTYTNTTYVATGVDDAAIKASSVIGVTKDYSGVLQYKAASDGLYIFRRSADITGNGGTTNNTVNPSYSGYYYNGGKFYALETLISGGARTVNLKSSTNTQSDVITADANGIVNGINVSYLVEEKGITQNDTTNVSIVQTKGNLVYTPATGGTTFTAAAANDPWTAIKLDITKGGKTVTFYIELASDWATNWTYIDGNTSANNDFGYFYYNKTLAGGETSAKLVDDVILDSGMTSENYLNLTYDLNVLLDSIQVTKDEYNNEVATQATGWATPTATNKSGTTPTEIDSISWA